jgi:hypothetical protein
MRTRVRNQQNAYEGPEPALSKDHLTALQEACAPVGVLRFPPPDIIRTLRQHGYVEIVLGGIQITPRGLERLLRERERQASPLST